jgi:hypothetical protein
MKARGGLGLFFAAGVSFLFAQRIPLNDLAIGYLSGDLTDPVALLSRDIEQGKVRLDFDPVYGYLPAALKALGIPVESQIAVFSKTSVQAMRIEPDNPRVLFFNDRVIAGWVRGGFVELASQDSRVGMVFYRLDQRPDDWRKRMAAGKPESPISRRDDCLRCHMTPATLNVPGALVRSVFPSPSGVPMTHGPQYLTDIRTPLERLWGGWYVTGQTGENRHLGNLSAADDAHPEAMLKSAPVHLDSLEGKCRADSRLTPYSDVVALLVLEHQMRMMNLITWVNWEGKALGAPTPVAVNNLVDYMLFVDEAPLHGEIKGTSGFAEEFASRGPKDSKGRSLRDLDLKHRLLRYPCSYMIYSDAFDALPPSVKAAIYRRMIEVLSHRDDADKQAILEILRETKNDFPAL